MSMSQSVNVSSLPLHTKVETIVGLINDTIQGRRDGFTIGLDLKPAPTKGYIVGTGEYELVANDLSQDALRDKVRFIIKNEAMGTGDRMPLIGGWRSPEGEVIVEISDVWRTKSRAQVTGRIRGQYSIWDTANAKEIVL